MYDEDAIEMLLIGIMTGSTQATTTMMMVAMPLIMAVGQTVKLRKT